MASAVTRLGCDSVRVSMRLEQASLSAGQNTTRLVVEHLWVSAHDVFFGEARMRRIHVLAEREVEPFKASRNIIANGSKERSSI